ncbi:hypothetical protein, partial [Alcaligenes faecalis]|uniref:hypothetical protein n=1 Tax=Alcaligenes faecalis TaxID=511 RepID=UPI001E31F62F
ASVLLKQHAPCIPPQHSAGGKSPDSPAKPYPGPTRKQATLFKAQTALESRNGLDLLKGGFVFLGTLQTGFELGLSTWVIGDVTGVEEKVGGN